ncbi:YtxH domain-containing protein [Spiroplasma sp. DGKH1]|uniref:YtxH domain-containing protein n=1 Tax=Spiroplasma sp. DGKH1 TaxID=3050074 RepID=UPI0034C5C647
MAFKLLKTVAIMVAGMLIAPKKGSELRADFVKMVKKYNPQLKEMVNKIEIVWEKSQGIESDEIAADIEVKIKNVKGAVDILDSASTKEMAYKALKKIDQGAVKLIKAAAKSPNVRAVAKDLAKITVSAIDAGIKVSDDLKKTSASISEKIIEEGHPTPTKKISHQNKK